MAGENSPYMLGCRARARGLHGRAVQGQGVARNSSPHLVGRPSAAGMTRPLGLARGIVLLRLSCTILKGVSPVSRVLGRARGPCGWSCVKRGACRA